jgi:small subunit ribosomal protein S20
MPNIKSAKKRMHTSRAANERNRAQRSRLRTAIKEVQQAADATEAQAAYKRVQVLLDRAATGRLLHPNAVARLKSNLVRRVNGMA